MTGWNTSQRSSFQSPTRDSSPDFERLRRRTQVAGSHRHQLPCLGVLASPLSLSSHAPSNVARMNRSGPEAFARLAQQLNRARLASQGKGGGGGSGGNPFGGIPGGGKGAATGGGLLALLAAGGIALSYSIFNGEWGVWAASTVSHMPLVWWKGQRVPSDRLTDSRRWSPSDQVLEVTWCPTRHLPGRDAPDRESLIC